MKITQVRTWKKAHGIVSMFKKSLHLRIIFLVVGLLTAGGIVSVALGHRAWKLAVFWIIAVPAGGAILSIFLKRSLTGPLRRNAGAVKKIAGGETGGRLEESSEDELGCLARGINGMLDALEKRAEENKRLLELVAGSRQEWVATFDAIQDLILIHDSECRVVKVNMALAARLEARPEDLIGKKCHEIFGLAPSRCGWCLCPDGPPASDENPQADHAVFGGVYRITTFPVVDQSGQAWARVHVARDVTQEMTLREQLVQAEKLSSIGMLVAGIAHELNNPLMGIMGFSQLLLDAPGDSPLSEAKGKLEKIYNESLRAARIVQNLLTFARQKKAERKYSSINEILNRTIELKAHSLKMNNIGIVLDLDERLPRTMVDPFQMQQVFINIMNNAEDAMAAANGGGTLTVRTRKSGGSVEAALIDDGPGIPKEAIGKVFDPFFTTKDVGKGTGLGLSIIHGIITEHGGKITIKSEAGKGAAFIILIPLSGEDRDADAVRERKEALRRQGGPASGKRVLIVDDEDSIRETIEDVFVSQGLTVETASEGAAALEALERQSFDLVVTDIRMPGIDGAELYENILRRHEGLKNRVIILTGDVFSPRTRELIEKYGCHYLLKPFEIKELTWLAQKMLS